MKVTVDKKNSDAVIKYPCLMESTNGRIILMNSKSNGTVVNNYKGDIGDTSEGWCSYDFKPFTGSVTLEND